MSVAVAVEVCGRFLWEGGTSNKPFEWTGRHELPATPTPAPCLPLKGSVGRPILNLRTTYCSPEWWLDAGQG